jgi:hypothetical protein
MTTTNDLLADLDRAISLVEAKPDLVDRAHVLEVLRGAREQSLRASEKASGVTDALQHPDEFFLSVVQSARSAKAIPVHPSLSPLTGKDIIGFSQYNDLDLKWLATLFNVISHNRVPFRAPEPGNDYVKDMADDAVIAMAGDWGAGNDIARAVGAKMAACNPHYTIHLGDVYYSGTVTEEQENFVDLWPAGSVASYALNSNHEMYSGGHGYFNIALTAPAFAAHEDRSFFALKNANWLLIGLDSAHAADGAMYSKGRIAEPQFSWMKSVVAKYGSGRKIIVLTHHHPFEMNYDGSSAEEIYGQVLAAIGRAPDFWYWGHVHGVAKFKAMNVQGTSFHPRCVGHGAIPYAPDPKTSFIEWIEDKLADGKRALNGFVVLRMNGAHMDEEFRAEDGSVRHSSSY